MKKKYLYLFLSIIIISTIFISLWNLVSGGYDKQNKLVLGLKKIIPRSLAVTVRDTFFIIPELKTQNKLLKIQVNKYEQGLDGSIFREQEILSEKNKKFIIKEFFLPFKQLDIKAGWNKLSNTFRAHYLEVIDKNVLVLSGEGEFIYFDKKNINNKKLIQKKLNSNLKELASENKFKFFGVRDLLYDDGKIYVSIILKNSMGFTMDIYVANYNLEYLNFSVFFKKNEFSKKYTIQTGGRLEKYTEDKILFSLGAAESLKNERVQNENYLEGKIIAIDKLTKKYQLVSKGHRNPQGLFFYKPLNLIINTEHGPQGGDEINFNFMNSNNSVLSNFGWPIASYGIEYDGSKPYKNSHSNYGFIEPFKNFTPSIGISEIIFLPKNKFLNESYLFVSSLRAGSIYLFQINESFSKILKEDRIFFSDQRIRDLEYDENLNVLFIIFEVTPSIGVLSLD